MKIGKVILLGLVVPALTAAALDAAHVVGPPVIVENVTPSLPLGLYRHVRGQLKPGAVVAVQQPAAARSYLHGLGFPPEALLLKRLVAKSGDRVCAHDAVVAVGGRTYARVRRDHFGALLPQWRGCRRLNQGEVFLAGDDPRSFDSRYFGPTSLNAIVGVYEPLR